MKKNLKKTIYTSIVMTGLMGIFSLGALQVKENKHEVYAQEEVNFKQDNKKLVSYDDENFIISLSANEVSNYYFHNFVALCLEYNFVDREYDGDINIKVFQISSDGVNFNTGRSYNNELSKISFDIDNDTAAAISWDISAYNVRYDTNFESYKFFNDIDDTDLTIGIYFKPNVTYAKSGVTESDIYNALKQAIDLDIQANQTSQIQGEDIVDAISSGLGLIPDLASEFLTGFTALFWNAAANSGNGALTDFAIFALVFLGIAITMAVIKLCLNILRGSTGE